jgi:hypothetical protein
MSCKVTPNYTLVLLVVEKIPPLDTVQSSIFKKNFLFQLVPLLTNTRIFL